MADLSELEAQARQARLAAENTATRAATEAETVRRDFLRAVQSRGIEPTTLHRQTVRRLRVFNKLIYGAEYFSDGWAFYCSRHTDERNTSHHFHCTFMTTEGELYSFDFDGRASDQRMQRMSAFSYKVIGTEPVVGSQLSGPLALHNYAGRAGAMAEYLASFDA